MGGCQAEMVHKLRVKPIVYKRRMAPKQSLIQIDGTPSQSGKQLVDDVNEGATASHTQQAMCEVLHMTAVALVDSQQADSTYFCTKIVNNQSTLSGNSAPHGETQRNHVICLISGSHYKTES